LGGFFQTTEFTALVVALAFQNGMQYHHQHNGIDTGDNAATSCKNLVNFGAVTPEITFLICVLLYGYWAKISL